MSEEEQLLQFLEEGLIYCPSCNRSEHIELIYVTTAIDKRIIADGETPNVFPISLVKCHDCGFDFELERVDPRPLKKILEVDFQNEFVAYTTEEPEKAIEKAAKWYNSHFDGQLGEPLFRTVGSTIYTTDSRVIIIPSEEGE